MEQRTLSEHDGGERLSVEEWNELRKRVLEADDYRCVNCGQYHNLEVHHIVPLNSGGTNRQTNLCNLCSSCHSRSHGKRPADPPASKAPATQSTRWVPSMAQLRELIQSTSHPLNCGVLLTLAKTGIGKGELCNLNIEDLSLLDSEVRSEYDLGQPQWAPKRHAALRIRLPDISEEYPGRRERAYETVVPIGPELIYALKRWLAMRPDGAATDALFVSTSSNWGQRVSPPIIGKILEQDAKKAGLYEKGAGEMNNLTAYTLRRFFAENFPADQQVRDYILDRVSTPVADLDELAEQYVDRVYPLLR